MEQLHQVTQTITPDDIAALRHEMQQVIIASGGDPEAAGDMILALNEAIVNSAQHGYQGRPGWLRLEVWRNGRSLIIKQYDAAPAFDPTAVPTPDTSLPLARRPLGGMGIHMMRHFSDELHYARTPNGHNELILIKYDAFVQS